MSQSHTHWITALKMRFQLNLKARFFSGSFTASGSGYFSASVLICLILICSQGPATGFAVQDGDGQSLHGKIVKDALSSTIDPSNLNLVIKSLDEKAGAGEAQTIKTSVAFVDREQKKILNYAAEADTSPASRYHLGS